MLVMPTYSSPESRCPFCRCSYRYGKRFETDICTKHKYLAELYFTPADPDSSLEDTGHLPYGKDAETDSDGEKIEVLDDEEDENVCSRKGPFSHTFADAGRRTEDVKQYWEHLQSLIEHPIEPFHDVYDFCLANWLINSKISMTKINKLFSSRLDISDGSFFKSAKTLHGVLNHLPTTLREPNGSLHKTKVIGNQDGAPLEDITYA
ncbi:hypothetical protein Q9L58_009944 [Maublancomyces gigas]|uniref:Transposase n=1 Tax=Discina gigas TaxID=1032678 RepID=A0ABR3G5G9_9PEZI